MDETKTIMNDTEITEITQPIETTPEERSSETEQEAVAVAAIAEVASEAVTADAAPATVRQRGGRGGGALLANGQNSTKQLSTCAVWLV
jgi:hypothetical protein